MWQVLLLCGRGGGVKIVKSQRKIYKGSLFKKKYFLLKFIFALKNTRRKRVVCWKNFATFLSPRKLNFLLF